MSEGTTSAEAVAVAGTITKQLGFHAFLELAVKTKYALHDKLGGVEYHLGGASITSGKRVRIVLDYSDTYEIEVYKVGRKGSKSFGEKVNVKCADNVYGEDLASRVRELVFS